MINGYMYCVYSTDGKINDYFTKQFLISIKSLRKAIPQCKISVYTNIKFENKYNITVIYDKKIKQSHIAKAYALLHSKYDKTILLDTDTLIHKSKLNDIFDVLDDFDFTCCHGNFWNAGSIYPDFNTGLIGVKHNELTNKEINIWIDNFNKGNITSDQKHFREIFMRNKNKFYVLPVYFMYRFEHYRDYPKHAVISHTLTMSKKTITKQLIDKYNKELKKN
jgi:hypothetical protein